MNYHKILYLLFPVLAVFCLAGLASCDYIHDELPLCRHTLRFVYRHNIKHADAFAYEMVNQEREKNVRLYIYDQDGKFLSSRLIEGEELKKNEVDLSELEPGDYRLLAWAGLNDATIPGRNPPKALRSKTSVWH